MNRGPQLLLALCLLCGCSTVKDYSPHEASARVPADYITRRRCPVTLEAFVILSHFGHTGDQLDFTDADGEKFILYRQLAYWNDAPRGSPEREIGRLTVGDSQTEVRLVDYRGPEGDCLLQILRSIPENHKDAGFVEECLTFLQKKRKGLPNQPPLRMPVSGTPAADAPVAPPPGIAGR